MAKALSLMLAQLNLTVGAIEDNTDKVLAAAAQAEQQGADLLVCSELALTGYPPEDLLLRADLMMRVEAALARVAEWQGNCAILVGHPWREGEALYNAASLYEQGQLIARYFKQDLPNYGVFDEKRYFTAASETCVVPFRGHQAWGCSSVKICGSRVRRWPPRRRVPSCCSPSMRRPTIRRNPGSAAS